MSRRDEEVQREMKQRTRRSFIVGGAAAMAALGGWRWLQARPEEGGIPWPLRRGLRLNEKLTRRLFDSNDRAPTLEAGADTIPRINGDLGLERRIDLDTWRLELLNVAVPGGRMTLTLDDIVRLPRTELTTYLYCIEGWSDAGRWAGAAFMDFVAAYPPRSRSGRPPDPWRRPDDLPRYVSLETPDRGYYVGLDLESVLHPQTLLCYEMGGEPLTPAHGAPLRLYTPVKYGIKSLKRIGRIAYTDERPADYWAERGYDWYAGL